MFRTLMLAMLIALPVYSEVIYERIENGEMYYALTDTHIGILPNKEITFDVMMELIRRHPHPEDVTSLILGRRVPVVDSTFFQIIGEMFPKLHYLSLHEVRIDNELLSELSINFPRLKFLSFDIAGDEPLSYGAYSLFAQMPLLDTFIMWYGPVDDDGVIALINHCPKISTLSLANGSGARKAYSLLTDRSLDIIRTHGKSMRHLTFTDQTFSWDAIKALLVSPHLDEFGLSLFRHGNPIPYDEVLALRQKYGNLFVGWSHAGREYVVPTPRYDDD